MHVRSSLENALSAAQSEYQEYRARVQKEMEGAGQMHRAELEEYQRAGENIENKLADYKNRYKQLQKSQKNGNSELADENEALRAAAMDSQAKVEELRKQLKLGEQAWLQQASILKASVQEYSDGKVSLLQQIETKNAELVALKERVAALQSAQPPPSASKSKPVTATENNTEQAQQILVLENKLRSVSINRKWQV